MDAAKQFEDLTGEVIGCAFRVFNRMGYGFLESVYERCMAVELRKLNVEAKFQCRVPVYYEGVSVGDFIADLIVNDCLIVELKSIETLAKAHEVQLVNYLIATGKPIGLLINFGPGGVTVRRKTRTLPTQETNPVDPNQSCDPVLPDSMERS